ncbi:hypothetical protein ABEG17_16825 [Pedococcus sp. KACC 23699]|uniref:Phage holin family protein n=1 Tax=Pedococcus sp. KACC 23699 TaxID=3149228 RepID=A0AAU7JSD7_9MICO
MKMRMLAAVGLLVSGAVHLWLWFDGYGSIAVIGPAFMVNAVAAVVIAALVLRWAHWAPLLLAIGFGVSTLAAFVTSATVGLFGVHERWTGGAVLTAAVSEVVVVVASVMALAHEHGVPTPRRLRHPLAYLHTPMT